MTFLLPLPKLVRGEHYRIDDDAYFYRGRSRTNRKHFFQTDQGGADLLLTDDELRKAVAEGRFGLTVPIGRPEAGDEPRLLDYLKPVNKYRAEYRREIVDAVLKLGKRSKSRVLATAKHVHEARLARGEWVERRVPSVRTIYRLLDRIGPEAPDSGYPTHFLVARHYRCGNRTARFADEVNIIIRDRIKEARDAPEDMPTKLLHARIAQDVRGLRERMGTANDPKFAVPSIKVIQVRLRDIGVFEQLSRTKGRRAAERLCRQSGQRPQASRILERVQADHNVTDLHLINPITGIVERAWLTIVIDEYSRVVLGMYIGFEPPSTLRLTGTVVQAMFPKTEILKVFPRTDWSVWGKPETILLDNAMEAHGTTFRTFAAETGLNIVYGPIRTPEYRSHIERFFHSMKKSFWQCHPGGVPDRRDQNEERNPQKRGCLTLHEIRERALDWLASYHFEPHENLGFRTPLAVWNEAVGRGQHVGLLPDMQLMIPHIGIAEERTPTREGIRFLDLRYDDLDGGEMARLRMQCGKHGKLQIRVDPFDVRRLWVKDEAGRRWILMPCVDAERVTRKSPDRNEVGLSVLEWEQRRKEELEPALTEAKRTSEAREVVRSGRYDGIIEDRKKVKRKKPGQYGTPRDHVADLLPVSRHGHGPSASPDRTPATEPAPDPVDGDADEVITKPNIITYRTGDP